MAIREGRWDCPTCGTVGLLGRQLNCTSCGDPRPEGVRFYLPEDAPEVTDASRLAAARAGADWLCEHCGASARALQPHCPGCGAERGGSAVHQARDYDLDGIPRSADDEPEEEVRPLAAVSAPARPRRGFRKRWVAIAAAVGGMVWWNQPKDVEAVVAGREWERAVEVQEYRTVREEGWDVPTGGRRLRSFRAVRDYRRVLDHYETRTRQVSDRVQVGTRSYTCGSRDLGNGNFEDRTCTEPEYETRYRTETYEEPVYRREPIYDTRYAYEIERWLPDDTARAAGQGAREPAWPEVKFGAKEREGARIERYVLELEDSEGNTYETEVPLTQFTRYTSGAPIKLRVQRSGKVEILEPGAGT
ncbi:MAG TPA: hypothetical protein VNP72_11175 [Longimicrobium sp.]|nr:hypothetical protein [Longimicrobium sp.]